MTRCIPYIIRYHRAAPAIKVDYVGPYHLPPTETAVFKVTLENAVQYYERGPSSGKSRPGWTRHDTGYKLPSFAFAVRPESLKYGLVIKVNGRSVIGGDIRLPGFGKGSTELIAELQASASVLEPSTNDGWRTYPAPVVTFGQRCENARLAEAEDIGEQATEATLGMAGTAGKQVVRFLQTCPEIEWSGKIRSDSTFTIDASVTASDATDAIEFVLSNPTGKGWTSESLIISNLIFEFRFQKPRGQTATWEKADPPVEFNPTKEGNFIAYIRGSWTGPPDDYPDGRYQIRVLSKCTNEALLTEHGQSSTAVLEGVVDRKPPAIASALPSSGGRHLLPGGMLTVTFDDVVVCSGTDDGIKPNFEIATTDDAAVTFSVAKQELNFVCQGTTVCITFTAVGAEAFNKEFSDASILENTEFKVSVVHGVADIAGNKATGDFLVGESTVDSLASYALSAGKIDASNKANIGLNNNETNANTGAGAGTGTGTDAGTGAENARVKPAGDAGASDSDKGASSAAGAATNSYVAAVLIILVMVGMFVYNQRALEALTVQIKAIRVTDLKSTDCEPDPTVSLDGLGAYSHDTLPKMQETPFSGSGERAVGGKETGKRPITEWYGDGAGQSTNASRVLNNEMYDNNGANGNASDDDMDL